VQDISTTARGFRFSTSVGGGLTGRGADFIIIDDPQKPEEAPSESRRQTANSWFDSILLSRLNDKRDGKIIIIQQRVHEDDLTGHVLQQGGWELLRFPAIAEEDEVHNIGTPYGRMTVHRRPGEALHPEREPLDILKVLRESLGEYNFAGQYQQSPAPLGGGLIKAGWLKPYSDASLPSEFDLTFQSWDTANKASELSDHSVCTTWGVKGKHLYLLHVYRKRIGFPDLKRAVRAQAESFGAKVVLIEDKASGTQLIQDLVGEGMHSIQRYDPTGNDKVSRLSWVTCTIENGFVHIPEKAEWLAEYVHELEIFPNGRFDDQVDSTSQALDWFANHSSNQTLGYIEFLKNQAKRIGPQMHSGGIPKERPCDKCNGIMSQPIPGGLRCQHCEAQWLHPDYQPRVPSFNRKDYFAGRFPSRRR
jgi:predicted phage terminase large subunit-like protein